MFSFFRIIKQGFMAEFSSCSSSFFIFIAETKGDSFEAKSLKRSEGRASTSIKIQFSSI